MSKRQILTDREAGYLMVVAREYYFQTHKYSDQYVKNCLRRKGFAKFVPWIGWRITKKGEAALKIWVPIEGDAQ